MTPETLAILQNREVIAIDRDPSGIQGDCLAIWSKPLLNGELESPMTLRLSDVGLKKAVNLHEVWTGNDIAIENGIFSAVVPKKGVAFLRIRNNSHFNSQ